MSELSVLILAHPDEVHRTDGLALNFLLDTDDPKF